MQKINFINNSEPAINATNLNKLQDNTEDAIQEVQDVVDDLDTNKLDKASVKDTYNTSATDTYCCDYINGLETYSTDETRVGTWIDGKPIYRKVLTGTLPVGAGSNSFTLSNISIINVNGIVHSRWGSWYELNSEYKSESGYEVYISLNNTRNEFSVNCGSFYNTSSEYEIIIEYTKTND